MQSLAGLTDPGWSSAYLRHKSAFIELVEGALGSETWRCQTSDRTSPTASCPASEETDLQDQRAACDNVAVEKPALAAGSPCSTDSIISVLPESVANPSRKKLSVDESLAGCDGGCSRLSEENLAGFSAWHCHTSKASSIADEGQQGRRSSKSSGVTEATADVGSTGPEDQETLYGRWECMDPKELAWRFRIGTELARRLQAEGPAAVMTSVPLNEDGLPTSLGSTGHALGTCRPCAYSSAAKGCDAGALCRYCHFDHHTGLRKARARPCKGKRDRYRKLVSTLAAQVEEDPTSLDLNDGRLPPSIKFDPRMMAKLSAKMSRHAEEVRRQHEVGAHAVAWPR